MPTDIKNKHTFDVDSLTDEDVKKYHKHLWETRPDYRKLFDDDPQWAPEKPKEPEGRTGDFVTGIKRGAQTTQAMLYGGSALAGRAMKGVGLDDAGASVMDFGIKGYQRNIKEAEKYPAKHSFKDVYTGEAGFGGAIDWAQGTLGELLPTMAEAALGTLIGTAVAPGAGSAAGAFASRTVLKKSIAKMAKEMIESGVKGLTEKEIRKQATKQALMKAGGYAGMGAAVFPLEAGGMYAGLLDEHGVDAPVTALLFGTLATAMEYAGGNSRLVDGFVDAIAKGSRGMIKKTAKELLTNIPQEAMQEAGQELMQVLHTVVNTDEELLTPEHVEQIVEAAGAGAVGGGAGAVASGILSRSGKTDQDKEKLPDPRRRVVFQSQHEPDDPSFIYGAATREMTTTQARSVNRDLNDLENPDVREKAVDTLEKAMKKAADTPEEGKRKADLFARHALEKIEAGEEIEIDGEMAEYAAMDPVDRGFYVKDTAMGSMDETIATLEKKINNLARLKKPNPTQQQNLGKFQSELAIIQESRSKLEEWDPEADVQQATGQDQATGKDQATNINAGTDSQAAGAFTSEELDKAGQGQQEGGPVTPTVDEAATDQDTDPTYHVIPDEDADMEPETGNAGTETPSEESTEQVPDKETDADTPEISPEQQSVIDRVDKVINQRARSKVFAELGRDAVPELRTQEHEEAGQWVYQVAKGEATQEEFDAQIEEWRKENRIKKPEQQTQEKEPDPGFVPNPVGKNNSGDEIFTYPVQPNKRWIEDKDGNLSGTEATPEQLFKEGKTRFLTAEEIDQFTQAEKEKTPQEIPEGAPVKYRTKKGEVEGTMIGPDEKHPGRFRVQKPDGKPTLVSTKDLIGQVKDAEDGTAETHDGKDIDIEGDTVSVDMPASEEKTLKPAEQKKYLVEEIDAAIKAAPDTGPKPEEIEPGDLSGEQATGKNLAKAGHVTIEVPGDGEFTILNTKTALAEFKKRAKKFPAQEFKQTAPLPGPAGTRKTNIRITGFAGEYQTEYTPKRSTKVPNPTGGTFYRADGWFSNGVTLVKGPVPKNINKNFPVQDFPEGGIEKLLEAGKSGNYRVTSITEIYENASGEDSDQMLTAVVYAKDAPEGKNAAPFDPVQLDHVMRFFPKADTSVKFHERKNGIQAEMFFKEGGEVVAVAMSKGPRPETDSQIQKALKGKQKAAEPADPVADRLKKAQNEVPETFSIVKRNTGSGETFVQVQKNGMPYKDLTGFNYTESGIDEAVRLAKYREAPKEKPFKIEEPSSPDAFIYDHFKSGKGFKNITEARKVIGEATGKEFKPGTTEAKQLDESVELAAVRVAREIVAEGKSPAETFDALVDLQNRMPNLSVRTSTSMQNQAYSTPLPLAYLASLRAGINSETTVFEPSAGNGALLIGANPETTIANEINKERVSALKTQGFVVNNEDGTTISIAVPADVVVANPPFGTVKDNAGNSQKWKITDNYTTTQVDHAMVFNTLEQMTPNGRAVFIIGSVNDQNTSEKNRKNLYRNRTKVQFFKHLMDNYNVVDMFSVSGKLYSKQGSSWPVDVIVIDGKGKSSMTLPGAQPPPYLSTMDQVKEKLNAKKLGSVDADGPREPGYSPVSSSDSGAAESVTDRTDVPGSVGNTDSGTDGGRGPGSKQGVSTGETGGNAPSPVGTSSGQSEGNLEPGIQPGDGGIDGRVEPVGSSTEQTPDGDKQRGGKTDQEPGHRDLAGQSQLSIDEELASASEDDLDALLDEAFGEDVTVPQDISEELQNMSEEEIDSLIDDVFDAPAKTEPTTKTKISDEKPDRDRRSTDVGLQSTRAQNEEAVERYLKNWARREARKNRPPKKPPKDTKDHLEDIALESLEGVKDAVSGLSALFTPRNTLSSGFIFNAETYKAAKPHFVSAWEHAKKAGYSLKQLIQHLATQFGAEIKPYLKRFFMEQTEAKKNKDKKPPKPKQAKADPDTQVNYNPASKSSAIGTLVPKAMGRFIDKALKKIQDKHGNIDKYVADQLGYTLEEVIGKDGKLGYFSAEQVDALALAMDNIAKGSGFIIGDQTGVGKGRVVAAMMRYAMRNGLTPIFVTHKPYLYADMYRDFTDIGMADIADRILMTNNNEKIPMGNDGEIVLKTKQGHNNVLQRMINEGAVSKDYDVVFTTYAQMGDTGSTRRRFLETISRGHGMLVMDEAHNAGGTAGDKVDARTGKVPSSLWFRELIQNAHSTFYSSATYAKRPDTMTLYSRTDMRLAVDDINDLTHAIGQGGVPLQQSVAVMLAEAGQYIRRERSYEGVSYDTQTVEIDKVKATNLSVSFADIKKFSDEFIDDTIEDIIDGGAAGGFGAAGTSSASDRNITTSGFSSIMHNLIDQSLMALKTPAAIDLAIQRHQEFGEKPVVALANTMGSFIKHYAEEHNLNPGDGIGLSFNDLVALYLDKTRRYKEETPDGSKINRYITDEQLGPAGVAEFNRIMEMIKRFDFSNIPVSPVDYVISRFKAAGMKAGEITGRGHTIEYRTDGTMTYQRRGAKAKSSAAKVETMRAFNSDEMDALILNQSGSTGLSLHALPKWEGHDPAKRAMILIQPERNIDTHMQMLGRVHRAGQVKAPAYIQLTGDIPTEYRPAAILAGKMASLNANTTASRGGKLEAEDAIDFINKYGNRVVANIMGDYPEIHEALGNPLPGHDRTASGLSERDAAKKVTGKIPLLRTIKAQEDLYDMVLSEYKDMIAQLDAVGQNDLEAKYFDTDARTLSRTTVFEGTGDSPFTSKAVSEVVDMKKIGRSYTSEEVTNLLKQYQLDMDSTTAKREQRTMADIQEAARAKRREMEKNAVDHFTVFYNQQMEDAPTDALRVGIQDRLLTGQTHWRHIFDTAIPGTVWEFPLGGIYLPMVVLKVEQKGTPLNPMALGTWRVTFAVPDSARRLEMSFSAINNLVREQQHLLNQNQGPVTDEALSRFDRARRTAREERTIMTGNLLAAYARYPQGRIINFTDDKGNNRQGILMSQTFNTQRAFAEQSVVLNSADDIMTVLDNGIGVKSRRGDMFIGNVLRGGGVRDPDNFSMSVPASRAKGGTYFLNQGLLSALDAEFVKRGNRMVVTVPKERLHSAFKHMLDNMNELFENATENQQVRDLLGQGSLQVEQVGRRQPAAEETQEETPSEAQFQTSSDYTPGQGVTLKDIQERFPGQSVFLSPDGSISIRMKNGLGLVVRMVKFGEADTRMAMDRGRMDVHGVVLGKYESFEIMLHKDLADNITLDHELWHFLEENLLTESERLLFQNKANAYRKAEKFRFEWRSDERENAANAFAQFLDEREMHRGTALGEIIQKILDFFDGLLHIARESERKLAREVESDRMYNRDGINGPDSENPDTRYNVQEDRLAYNDSLYANEYVSRRIGRKLTEKEKEVGRMAYGIKGLVPEDVEKAAKEMVAKIPGDKSKAILVPIPGHTGDTSANVAIAKQMAKETGATVSDILQRKTGPSQRDLRASRKKTQTPAQIQTGAGEKITNLKDVYFIDNVITSGATIRSARDAVGGGRGLVYAKSFSKGKKYTFAGPEAIGADKAGAFEAQQMRDAGASRKDVWDKTGWWELVPGSDVWSFEIDDSEVIWKKRIGNSSLNIETPMYRSVGQFFRAPELFKSYPWLQDVLTTVTIDPKAKNTDGIYVPADKRGDEFFDTEQEIRIHAKSFEDAKSMLLHEIQHAIQNYEGFATGGSTSDFARGPMFDKKLEKLAMELFQATTGEVRTDIDELADLILYADKDKVDKVAQKHGFDNSKAAIRRLKVENTKRTPFGQYQRLTGETQARLTQRRSEMSAKKRKAEPPWQTMKMMLWEEGLIPDLETNPEDVLITRYDAVPNYHIDPEYRPKKTIKAYKLMQFKKTKPGQLFPLFIGKNKPIEMGKWMKAEHLPTKGFAPRPGWHAGHLPIAPHLRQTSTGKKHPNRVWVEIEMPADKDWQAAADSGEYGNKIGKSGRTKDIRDQIPKDGYYKFTTSKMQGGAWLIGGAAKFNRVLNDDQVAKILNDADFSEDEIQKEMHGKEPQYSTSSDRLDPMGAMPKPVQVRMKKARGVTPVTLWDRVKAVGKKLKADTRHFPALIRVENANDRAVYKEILRQHQDISITSQDKAIKAIHGYVSDMSQAEHDLYSLRLILGDEVANIKDGARTEKNLPFGFTSKKELLESYKKIQNMVAANPKVKKAIKTRQDFQHNLAREMVHYGILDKKVLESKEYFHHQVLHYWNLKESEYKGLGVGSSDARSHWRPWMAKRKDSPLDYNTEYVEAELMATAQMIAQVETAKSLEKLKSKADITRDLKDQAKETNYQAIDRIFYRLTQQGQWKRDPKTGEPEDPMLPYRQKIAMGFSNLAQMAQKGSLGYDPGFEGVIQALRKSDGGEVSHPQIFQFLTNQIDKNYSGAMYAAMIYKAIKARDAFVKETLGDRFKKDTDIIPKGYIKWEPQKNKGWFKVNTLSEKVLEQVISGEKALADSDVKQVMAKGTTPYWIIPEGLADTMDNFRLPVEMSTLGRASGSIMRHWKQYILMNPLSVFRYNLNNMSGDLDATMAFDPKIATYARQAFHDLRKWMKHQKNPELERARDMGVIGSGFSIQEVEDTIQALGVNGVLDEVMMENPGMVAKYWSKVRGLTTLRENMLRLAAYRYFKDQHKKGIFDTYGASDPQEIKALVKEGMADDAAAKMARELLGDYGAVSRHGEYLRRHLIPFYSWMEINLPRYVYLMRNLKHEGGVPKGGANMASALAIRGTKFALKASILFASIVLYNRLIWPDEDDELGEAKRGQMHLILGRTKEGSIRTVRFEGALSDALSWFGLEDVGSDIKDVKEGSASISDKAMEAGKAFANRWIQGIRPDFKTGAEALTGKAMYPDAFATRPIRDKLEHVLGTVKMQMPYQWVTGKPKPGASASEQLANDLLKIFTYTVEPGVQAYYDTRSKVYDWKDKNGLESGGGSPTSKGNALYYYKQAMKYGDLKAAEKYIRQYAELGGTAQGIKQSIRMAHPLAGISKKNRARFYNDLTPADKKRLKQAIKWYQSTYLQRR